MLDSTSKVPRCLKQQLMSQFSVNYELMVLLGIADADESC
ncbi:hypothetical protein PCC8801_0139 [Rippkaea orientalis PCC 8801]|uniref:Uncharacterized protein n=1 Tax=Rippkaea orientalis (strain PCC 8801 / RF-1) TaxID=41431 RepID=B7K1T8_RIPO1|nr:hypothetical protein PCC8801_0139 [Rippkaea orientalis PCC 8801]